MNSQPTPISQKDYFVKQKQLKAIFLNLRYFNFRFDFGMVN